MELIAVIILIGIVYLMTLKKKEKFTALNGIGGSLVSYDDFSTLGWRHDFNNLPYADLSLYNYYVCK